jgi:hypothetical protein
MTEHFRTVRLWSVAAAALVVLGGCGDTLREQFGFGRHVPDEYQVVEAQPLAVPPDFHLRPPAPGAPRPQERDVRRQAEEIVLGPNPDSGNAGAAPPPRTPGELALLNMVGANEADPGIRQVINRESAVLAADDEGFVNDLMFWEGREVPGVALDPVAEAQRLRENAAAGRAPTYGDTPIIVRRERAPLEDLF